MLNAAARDGDLHLLRVIAGSAGDGKGGSEDRGVRGGKVRRVTWCGKDETQATWKANSFKATHNYAVVTCKACCLAYNEESTPGKSEGVGGSDVRQ
jgi:hypothetical protein